MPPALKYIAYVLLCIAPGTLAIFGWGNSEVETTLVITAASTNKNDLRPEKIVLRQKGSTVYWTATCIHYVEKPGKPAVFESQEYEGKMNVKGIDLAKAFDEVKAKETNASGPIPRTGTLPYSIVLVAKNRVGICPDLNTAQRDEFAKETSLVRKVLDDISHAGVYARENDMLDFIRYPGARGSVIRVSSALGATGQSQ